MPTNVNAPNGLTPYAPGGGAAATNFVLRRVKIAYNDTAAIYKWDPVKNLSTGYVARWTAGTAVSQLAGVFMGAQWLSQSLGYERNSPYWPGTDAASTTSVWGYIIPCDLASPQWFVLQMDATGATLADINANLDVTMTAGSTTTGISAVVGTAASINTTNTLPFKIMQLYDGIDNTGTGAYAKVVVAANITNSTGI